MSATAPIHPHPDDAEIRAWLDAHFGVGDLPELSFWVRTDSQTIWAASAGIAPPEGVPLQSLGIKAFRRLPPRGKPTSTFIALFGGRATRNVCDLNAAQTQAFISGERLTAASGLPLDGHGYQVVRAPWGVLGCGEIRGGELKSLLPKHWLYGQPPLDDFAEG